ncbi:hypothetical protein DNTS_006177, partial [Danionella cerebrum]
STRLLAREVTIPYRLPPSQHKPDDSYELLLIREEYEKRKQKLHQLDHWRFMAERDYWERKGETALREDCGNLINKPVLSQQAPVAPGHLPALQTPFRGLTQTECRVPQPRPVSYSDALKQQIAEKQLRKEREKQEQELYNSKIEAERREYSYWGRGGGGAPLRDNSGNLITDLKAHLRNYEARESGPRAERKPASPKTVSASVFATPTSTRSVHARGNIEDKKRRKAEEREKQRMEDEMEERRLAQQRESMRKEYEQEQEKKRRREKEYEDARRKQMEERQRMRENEKRQIAVEPEAVQRKPQRTPEKVQEVKERLLAREVTIPYRLPPSQHKPDDSYELFLIREEYEKRKQKLIEELHQLDRWRFMAEKRRNCSQRGPWKPHHAESAGSSRSRSPASSADSLQRTHTNRVPSASAASCQLLGCPQAADCRKAAGKEREKQEQELNNSKIEAESREYSYWGRGGGGAPLRDNSGNLITDLKAHLRNYEARESGPRAERKPASPKTVSASVFATPTSTRSVHARGNYEDARRKQMEERQRMRENEKRQIAVEPEAVQRKPQRTPEKVQEVKEFLPSGTNSGGTENTHANLHSNTTVGQICEEEKAKMTRAFSQLRELAEEAAEGDGLASQLIIRNKTMDDCSEVSSISYTSTGARVVSVEDQLAWAKNSLRKTQPPVSLRYNNTMSQSPPSPPYTQRGSVPTSSHQLTIQANFLENNMQKQDPTATIDDMVLPPPPPELLQKQGNLSGNISGFSTLIRGPPPTPPKPFNGTKLTN